MAQRRALKMRAETERRVLQIAIGLACLVPLVAGAEGVRQSAAMLAGVEPPLPRDLESHFRYLSGLLLGIGLVFAASIPTIERRTATMRALGFVIVIGGLARLFSLLEVGAPGPGHIFGLVMELGVVPALVLWQGRVARRYSAPE
jgi:hypothetical protein